MSIFFAEENQRAVLAHNAWAFHKAKQIFAFHERVEKQ